jgi:TetR/AcrR family transcriptional regulator, transcriptional repressor for nem operon
MRYAKGHKDETHKHIVTIASQRFREEGIEKVGVAALMEHAGLTVGGFYSHFKSKEELVREAVGSAADETLCRIFGRTEDGDKISLRRVLELYLSVDHRDGASTGCVVAALASELRNRPAKTRAIIANKTMNFIERIADRLSSRASAVTRLRVASSIWAVMVGTLQLSRIVPDQELSKQLLKDGIANALRLASEVDKSNAA